MEQLADARREELRDSAKRQTGVRPAGRLEARDLRFDGQPGQPLAAEPR